MSATPMLAEKATRFGLLAKVRKSTSTSLRKFGIPDLVAADDEMVVHGVQMRCRRVAVEREVGFADVRAGEDPPAGLLRRAVAGPRPAQPARPKSRRASFRPRQERPEQRAQRRARHGARGVDDGGAGEAEPGDDPLHRIVLQPVAEVRVVDDRDEPHPAAIDRSIHRHRTPPSPPAGVRALPLAGAASPPAGSLAAARSAPSALAEVRRPAVDCCGRARHADSIRRNAARPKRQKPRREDKPC